MDLEVEAKELGPATSKEFIVGAMKVILKYPHHSIVKFL